MSDDDQIECDECGHVATKDEDGFYCCDSCDWMQIDERLTTWGRVNE